MNLGLLHTGIRAEEKLIQKAANQMDIEVTLIDVRKVTLDPSDLSVFDSCDVIIERCISSVRGNAVIEFLSSQNITVVNSAEVMYICNDKFLTASTLARADVPVVRSMLVFDEPSAKEAVETLGSYPIVLKSRYGSWGRLIAKANDAEALEAVFDHRKYMSPEHSAVVVQEYIEKPERDIRVFVIGDEAICAIYRTSPHWITNTARGGVATNCPLTDEIRDICRRGSEAVGGGILAFDLFETENGLIVNEINHTMEFKNSEAPTGVSISGEIVNYCKSISK